MAEWISVNDDNPPKQGYNTGYNVVVKCGNDKKVITLEWMPYAIDLKTNEIFYNWNWHHRMVGWEVTHWMPLPELPKEEKKE